MKLFRNKLSRILQPRINGNKNRYMLQSGRAAGFSMPQIRGALIKINAVNVAELARQDGGITAPTIYAAAYGKRLSGECAKKAQSILSDALGLKVGELFPREEQPRRTGAAVNE